MLKRKMTEKSYIEKKADNEEDRITPQYRYIKELAKLKYEAEEKREQSLIQQSSQMQTAFSFMTVAIFMAVPICVEYRGEIPLKFLLVATSITVMFLMVSLVLASIAQWRWKTKTFPDVSEIKENIINSDEWEKLIIEYNQIDQWIDIVGKIQTERSRLNGKRAALIIASMICLYCAILSIAISFVIVIFMLI